MSAQRDEQLFLHAADALEPEERVQIEADLLADPSTREALDVERTRLAELALVVEPEEPPATVRSRLLVRVGAASAPNAAAPPVTGRRRSWRAAALAAGAVVALLSGVSTWAYLRERVVSPLERRAVEADLALEQASVERGELDAALSEQDEELAGLEAALERAQEQIVLLRSPGLQSVALRGTGPQPRAEARVFWEWEDYTCYLYARELRPPEADHVFALWLYNEAGRAVRAGTFSPDAGGEATLFVKLPRDTGRVVRSLVTEEPVDLGDQPSGTVILASREPLL